MWDCGRQKPRWKSRSTQNLEALGAAKILAWAALGEALGKPVKYLPVPVAAMVESLAKMGLDDHNQVALRDYFTAYSRGWESQVTSAVQDLTGIEARGIAEFARDHAAAFGKR